MTAARLPQPGSVVWAELEDSNGFRKVRPAIVVSAWADIVAGGRLRVIAVTTRLDEPLPGDYVLLPWDRDGKARSGLRRKCAAVTTWQAEISIGDVQQVVGILPSALITQILKKVVPDSSSTPDSEHSP